MDPRGWQLKHNGLVMYVSLGQCHGSQCPTDDTMVCHLHAFQFPIILGLLWFGAFVGRFLGYKPHWEAAPLRVLTALGRLACLYVTFDFWGCSLCFSSKNPVY